MSRSVVDVYADLSGVVERCRREESYLGLFPAMYRSVTAGVRARIDGGYFDDPVRVERLVVGFADRYLDALAGHRDGRTVSRCWQVAFEQAEQRWRRSLVQHLMLGMNAHIVLDLGVATAAVNEPGTLPAFRADFERVNDLLFARLDDLQGGLNDVSPWMGLLDWAGHGWDEGFMRLSIRTGRDRAWYLAEQLLAADERGRAELVAARDAQAHAIGRIIGRRLSFVHLLNRVVLLRETRDVPRLIDALARLPVN